MAAVCDVHPTPAKRTGVMIMGLIPLKSDLKCIPLGLELDSARFEAPNGCAVQVLGQELWKSIILLFAIVLKANDLYTSSRDFL